MWQHNYEPIAGSLGTSALVAAIPIVVLFLMLGVFRKPAWLSAASALASALLVAILVYGMPAKLAILSTLYGAAYGFFPIAWIVFASIMLYRLAVDTGKFEIIKDSVGSPDRRPAATGDVHRVLVRRVHRRSRRLRRAGCGFRRDARRPRVRPVLCRRNLSPREHGPGRLRIDWHSGHDAGQCHRTAGAVTERNGRPVMRDDVHSDSRLSGGGDGRTGTRAGGAAGDCRVRCVVCRRAVLRLELHRTRADRHPQFADMHRRDGGRAQTVAAQDDDEA